MNEKIYYLFQGSSEDGRGTPRYIGYTTDKDCAEVHLMLIERDPYSFGHVIWYDDEQQYICHGKNQL